MTRTQDKCQRNSGRGTADGSEGRAGGGRGLLERPAGGRTRHGLRLRAQGATEAWPGTGGTPPPAPAPLWPGDGHRPACRAPGLLSEEADPGIWPWDTYRGTTEKGTRVSSHREGRETNKALPHLVPECYGQTHSSQDKRTVSLGKQNRSRKGPQRCSRRHSPTPAAPSLPSPGACWARRPASWYPRAASPAREEAELA